VGLDVLDLPRESRNSKFGQAWDGICRSRISRTKARPSARE